MKPASSYMQGARWVHPECVRCAVRCWFHSFSHEFVCARASALACPVAAGIPLSIIVKDFGWSAYFTTLIGACAVALLLLSPMTRLRSYVQREEVRMAREAGAKKEQ